jgi:hypothetical protein
MKTFNETVKQHRTIYTDTGDQGLEDQNTRQEPTEEHSSVGQGLKKAVVLQDMGVWKENGWGEEMRGEERASKRRRRALQKNCGFPKIVLKVLALDNAVPILFVSRRGISFTAIYHMLTPCVKILFNDSNMLHT